jgi:hypothetical protein
VESTAWRDNEAELVNRYPKFTNYYKTIKDIFHKGLVRPWPYCIGRIVQAALFIYGRVTKLFDPKAFIVTVSDYDLMPEIKKVRRNL